MPRWRNWDICGQRNKYKWAFKSGIRSIVSGGNQFDHLFDLRFEIELTENQQCRLHEQNEPQYHHNETTDEMGNTGVFVRGQTNLFETIKRDEEHDQVIDHVHENIKGVVTLFSHPAEIVHIQNLCEGLRNAHGTGEFDDVH